MNNLPYYLSSTGDTTDRTAEIEQLLAAQGACLLGNGIYYVSGVKMPPKTTLFGLGAATKLVLLPSEEAAAVQLDSECCVKDLSLYGAWPEAKEYPTELGKRHGILFKGTATKENWQNQPQNCIVSGCQMRNFSGGGLTCVDTGFSTSASITATNCHIRFCGCGIYIPHFSEYHEFTNMLCERNLYGCINNGGNNVFVNCGFNSNKTAFVMDNADGKAINNTHGSVVGCSFNHSGKNEGVGLWVRNTHAGYVFTGCQVFYSKIIFEDSDCLQISNTNFGRNTQIEVHGGKITLFNGCLFLGEPQITVEENQNVHFANCYTTDGNPVDIKQ